ncbi:MAG TPA: SPOR domain-containing protein [Chitinophagaceae bacterium]|nr:SPOR domain-containing protein [Chitinophagaceae bacterium]
MQKLIFLSLLVMAGYLSPAQENGAVKDSIPPTVIVHKDPRLDLLVNKQAEVNEYTSRDARKTGKGFRLMVITSSSRDEAIAAKATVYTYFPELKAYLWHQSPYYKVKAGNFKDRKDAETYQKRMSAYFPKGVFIMNDVIELKPDKSREEDF